MKRNLNRRVETLFPVLQPDLKQRTIDIYNEMWADNVKARILHDETYSMIDRRGKEAVNAQEFFIYQAEKKNAELKLKRKAEARKVETFEAIKRQEDDLKLGEKKDSND